MAFGSLPVIGQSLFSLARGIACRKLSSSSVGKSGALCCRMKDDVSDSSSELFRFRLLLLVEGFVPIDHFAVGKDCDAKLCAVFIGINELYE